MKPLLVGDVLELPVGLRCYHNQGQELTTIQAPVVVVVESAHKTPPGSEDDHFEECRMVTARALNIDGSYNPEGALLTFAQYGDFRPEYILPEKPNQVLRKLKRTFVAE